MMPSARADRRALVARHPKLRGIDGVDVTRSPDGQEVELDLHFIPAAPDVEKKAVPTLDASNFRLEGNGARAWAVKSVGPSPSDPELGVRAIVGRMSKAPPPDPFTMLVLRLTGVPDVAPPFDAVGFAPYPRPPADEIDPVPAIESAGAAPSSEADYLAKDYASFRQLMLDRLAWKVPEWSERHVPDVGLAMVEVLAYAADYLSYYQDAVATEAYLNTARLRTSVRRHARTLDFRMHEGCAPRVWIHIDSPVEFTIESGLTVTTAWRDVGPGKARDSRPEDAFVTVEPITCRPENNALPVYDYGEQRYELAAGATRAALEIADQKPPQFADGDVLIFEQVADALTGSEDHVDPRLRHAVRLRGAPLAKVDPLTGALICEIVWDERDALPFPLVVTARIALDGRIQRRMVRALGNNVPAEFGLPVPAEALDPAPSVGRTYRPQLNQRDVTFHVPYDPAAERALPASALTDLKPYRAVPNIVLQQYPFGDMNRPPRTWLPVRDLLATGPDARVFAVEPESDGTMTLRFGDGVHGRIPEAGWPFQACYSVGNGPKGHVGSDTLVFTGLPRTPEEDEALQEVSLRNPLPSAGGIAPMPLDQARREAPAMIRVQRRFVIEKDYQDAALRLPGVRAATVDTAFTGSWRTARLFVQRTADGGHEDTEFLAHVRESLEWMRLIDVDFAVLPPTYVAVEIAMIVDCKPGVEPEAVRAQVRTALTAVLNTESFSFGQSVYSSPLIAAAMSVRGVADAHVTRLARVGAPRAQVAQPPVELPPVTLGKHEIARVERCLVEVSNAKPVPVVPA